MKNGNSISDQQEDNQLQLLRDILFKKDREQIDLLKETMFHKDKLNEQVSPILEERLATLKKEFPEEFGGMVNSAIEQKLEDSKEQLLNVIYPVLGQMIRKYVNHQFQMLKERIDTQVNNAFSTKNLIRRVRSQLFGVNDSDQILSDIDTPEIEELYVIQSESGLLLGNYSRNKTIDKELIAGMLTAIKSFVEDAFELEKQKLELIEYGNYKILLQSFYKYYVAVVLSGSFSSLEKDKLSGALIDFADKEMNVNMAMVDSALRDDISQKLESHFKQNIFLQK